MSTATVYVEAGQGTLREVLVRLAGPVPGEGQFGGDDFLADNELTRLTRTLIATAPHFAWLRGWEEQIAVLWKRKGGTSGGKDVLGKCQPLSGTAKHFAGKRYLIWLAADTCRKARLTEQQLEAAVYHELCHLAPGDIDEDTGEELPPKAVGHGWEGFSAELARYGAWQADLVAAKAAFDDLPLFRGLGGSS